MHLLPVLVNQFLPHLTPHDPLSAAWLGSRFFIFFDFAVLDALIVTSRRELV